MNVKFFTLLIFVSISSFIFADEAAIVKTYKGQAHLLREGKEIPIEIGTQIFEKDTIRTEAHSLVGLIFKDNTRMSIGQKSEFTIEEYEFNLGEKKERFTTNLSKGSLECVTGLISKVNPETFKLKTKTATMGIRGTHFIVESE